MILNKEVVERLQMGDESALIKSPIIEITSVDTNYETPWTLHYKAVHNVGLLHFKGPVEKEEAFKLGNIYCSKRNWRFIQVRPMFTDISIDPQTEEERARYNK